ncbi:MAG: asparagine synthase (glutamine-hydrolyzing) [Rhodospirillaceae bacterium]|jgi:asparagine synthase (glutamine-hydrolysing)|nr:asparagine synthase (glutamine-hydrolyzing) [Rhodospirillaceae bacterium]MBT7356776.1 asparagine synthase (glutamine-hydrolyzing) [Rhodospirillaceae bacterium]
MCGIAGIVGQSPVNGDAVRAMTDLMVHRGPDGEGLWQSTDGRTCLGHRRLAVLDLHDRAAQPMTSVDEDLVLTYNGEIYNYLELKSRLEAEGVIFRTSGDTEVVLEAYRAWGEDCLGEFNGMFAFAIYDRRQNRLFCARDRFGEKPFLFLEQDGVFAFASEYKALFVLAGVDVDIDERALINFFDKPASGLDHDRDTVFRGICQLLPGEKLTVELDDLSWAATKYWTGVVAPRDDAISDADAITRFRDLLADAVKIRLRSDVATGSCLSGGLDSSAITYLSRGLQGDDAPYHTFTGRFPGSPADEGAWAEQVAAATSAKAHETFPDAEGFMTDVENFIWLNELPVDSASQYAQWCVFRTAADAGVTVLLDGQGADEILGGYEQYFVAYCQTPAGRSEEAKIRKRYPMAFSNADQGWKKALPSGIRRFAAHMFQRGTDLRFGIRPEWDNAMSGSDSPPESLLQALHRDSCDGFLTTLLRYGDRNSMAHSREVRLPFCDHRIAEFAFSLPPRLLMGEAQTKRLLREAMRGVLPEPIRTRWNKQGFLPPQADWLRGELFDVAEDLFNSPSFITNSIWDASWWQGALGRLRAGEGGLATALWKPFISELWTRHFVERVKAQPRVSALIQ